MPSGSDHVFLFFFSDCPVGSAILGGSAGFDFDKDQDLAVTRDDIDLTSTARRAIIASKNPETGALEKTMREVLAAAAKGGLAA